MSTKEDFIEMSYSAFSGMLTKSFLIDACEGALDYLDMKSDFVFLEYQRKRLERTTLDPDFDLDRKILTAAEALAEEATANLAQAGEADHVMLGSKGFRQMGRLAGVKGARAYIFDLGGDCIEFDTIS